MLLVCELCPRRAFITVDDQLLIMSENVNIVAPD